VIEFWVWAGFFRLRYEELSGMTTQVAQRAFGPKQVEQLREIYERARVVTTQYPESHVANKAARKLIDAFEAAARSERTCEHWLSKIDPQGNA